VLQRRRSFAEYERRVAKLNVARLAARSTAARRAAPGHVTRVERCKVAGRPAFRIFVKRFRVDSRHRGMQGSGLLELAAELGAEVVRVPADVSCFILDSATSEVLGWRHVLHPAMVGLAARHGGAAELARKLYDKPACAALVKRSVANGAGAASNTSTLGAVWPYVKLSGDFDRGKTPIVPASWTQKREAAGYVDLVKEVVAAMGDVCEAMQPHACARSRAAIRKQVGRFDMSLPLTDLFTTAQCNIATAVNCHDDPGNAAGLMGAVAVVTVPGKDGEEPAGGSIVAPQLMLDFPSAPLTVYSLNFRELLHVSAPVDVEANAASGAARVAIVAYTPARVLAYAYAGRVRPPPRASERLAN
jgi:hypothetical protein